MNKDEKPELLRSTPEISRKRGVPPVVAKEIPENNTPSFLIFHASKMAAYCFCAGCFAGVIVVGANAFGLENSNYRHSLNALFFIPAALSLAGFGATIATRVLFVFVSGGKDVGSFDSLRKKPPADNGLETVIVNLYIILGIVTAFLGGYFVSSWSVLLVTGKLWLLIGAR